MEEGPEPQRADLPGRRGGALHRLAIGLFGPGKVWGATAKRQKREGVVEACDMLAVHSGVRVTYDVSRMQVPRTNHLVINGEKGEIFAPHFFTEQSAPWIRVESGGTERVVKRAPGNPYRKVVGGFRRSHPRLRFESPGTTVAEAVVACRMIDEAQVSLGVAAPLELEAEMVERSANGRCSQIGAGPLPRPDVGGA